MLVREKNTSVISADSKLLILGLGKSGVSVARFLRARGQSFIAVDTRLHPPGIEELENLIPREWLQLGEIDQSILNSMDTIVASPGLALSLGYIQEAINHGVEVIGDIELFARFADAPIVAITGSNGKTTVTSLLGQMGLDAGVNVKVGGNIGVPALDLLSDAQQSPTDFYILELSSFQLETTRSLNANIVTVLNISPDHMDRYTDVDQYAASKYKIYNGAGVVVINKQELSRWGNKYQPDEETIKQGSIRLASYGVGTPAEGEFGIHDNGQEPCIYFGDEVVIPLAQIKLLGAHNYQNVLAALALGREMGLAIPSMVKTIAAYSGLPHRTQWVAEHNNVIWINDSKGTNVGATIAALQGLPGAKILIAGGVGKDADFSELQSAVENFEVKLVILFGQDAKKIERALQNSVKIKLVESLESAVQVAKQQAQAGWKVLFSPACASFDMFENYEQRGQAFISIVNETLQCQ